MVAFFHNIWAWISAHAAQIAGLLTPPNLVLLVVAFVQLWRQKRTIAANTGSSKELVACLKENEALKAEVKALREQCEQLSDGMAQCLTKLNCVLEVQQQAYSVSLAKTQTLDAINSIIANGKFAETQARKAITEEVAELRAQMEALTEATVKSEEKVKRIAGVSEVEKVETQRSGRYV